MLSSSSSSSLRSALRASTRLQGQRAGVASIAGRSLSSHHAPTLKPLTRSFHSISSLSAAKSNNNAPTNQPKLRGMMTLDELKARVAAGSVENVIMGFPDMYGRMLGKRFDADFFLASAAKDGTHACDYLLACDMEMTPIPGFEYANWERGFGDFHMVVDWSSLRHISWQEKTVLVLCDIYDSKTHKLVEVAPRSVLRKQIDEANRMGFSGINAASELEYYQYKDTYRDAHAVNYQQKLMTPTGDYFEDYHLLQTAREEPYTSTFRHHLKASGIPTENSKGECGIGQHELNVRYAEILPMADRHLVYKQCLKEVADQMGMSVTFMAKPFTDATGSGCHIHMSILDEQGRNAFVGEDKLGPVKCSKLFQHFLAGWMRYTKDFMVFYAPTINSYKRFISSSWAPTRLAWSYDNRTAGYRVVGEGQSLRIECRIPGADANPYLVFAASLASGLEGIRKQLVPPPVFEGNIYEARELEEVPKSLGKAVEIFRQSEVANELLGESVVKHYAHFYEREQAAYDKAVTDWERVRYFERI